VTQLSKTLKLIDQNWKRDRSKTGHYQMATGRAEKASV
jgi:hypothetical protein